MDNRFTVKDFAVFSLLVLVLVVLGLAIVQYDRQWESIKRIEGLTRTQTSQLEEVTRRMTTLQAKIASGAVVPGGVAVSSTQPATQAVTGPAKEDIKAAFAAQAEAMTHSDYAHGDWLVQNLGTRLSKLTPLLSSDIYATIIQARVLESLAYRDPNTFEWRPQLATDWSVSTDGLQITFNLRKGVLFSDGQPFTSADVVWTFDWICNEAVDAPRDRAFIKENIKSITADGPHRVTFNFSKPYFESFSLAAGFTPLPKHFYGEFDPKKFNESVGLLLGTGPYRLPDPQNWRPGSRVELVPNERYWGLRPPFDRLLYYEVENDAAELTMFRNGELDIFGAQPEQYVSMVKDPSITTKSKNFEYSSITGGYSYIAWNELRQGKPTTFADKRVRQALTMLIDRQRMARDIYLGFASPVDGPFLAGNQQNSPNVSPWPYDLGKARALLKEAGFEDRNGDGVLEDQAGKRFEFSLIYPSGSPIYERSVLFIKDSFARAGIIVKLDATDFPIMLEKINKKDFDAMTLGWSGGVETDLFQMFHSSQSMPGGDNYMSYKNKELDTLIEKARSTVDEKLRMPLWQRAHEILHEDQPYTFLLNRQSLIFIDNRIKNVSRGKSGLNFVTTSAMPYPWYVPLAEQKYTR